MACRCKTGRAHSLFLNMHSFHAYIDESGDEGFSFRDFPSRGSSEWFVLSAVVVRESLLAQASRALLGAIGPLEERRKNPIHFANLTHDQQSGLSFALGKMPVRCIAICANKRKLTDDHGLAKARRLYFYCVRFLLERISWITRDHRVLGQGNGSCRLTFSACKGLSYEKLAEYMSVLQAGQTQISWAHLDAGKFKVLKHEDSIWLRAADIVASGVGRGLELSPAGLCEDRFARHLQQVVYHRGNNYSSYGMKFFPERPDVEKERDNRYSWLSLYK